MNGKQIREFNMAIQRIEELEKLSVKLLQYQIQLNKQMGRVIDILENELTAKTIKITEEDIARKFYERYAL